MTGVRLGSALLASEDPTRLRDWYAQAFSPEASEVEQYHVLSFAGFYLMFDRRDDVTSPAA